MPGVFKINYSNGITKLINLRNVCAVSLQAKSIKFEYNFPCVTGENYYERVESRPAYEKFDMPTVEEAEKEFDIIRKEMDRLE